MVFLYAGFKFIVAVSAVAILLSIVAPLAVFIKDLLENPACIEIRGSVIEEVNQTHCLVELEIKYCSTVKAKDVNVVFGESKIYVGTLERGSKSINVILSRGDIEAGLKSIELNIAGLYRLNVLFG